MPSKLLTLHVSAGPVIAGLVALVVNLVINLAASRLPNLGNPLAIAIAIPMTFYLAFTLGFFPAVFAGLINASAQRHAWPLLPRLALAVPAGLVPAIFFVLPTLWGRPDLDEVALTYGITAMLASPLVVLLDTRLDAQYRFVA